MENFLIAAGCLFAGLGLWVSFKRRESRYRRQLGWKRGAALGVVGLLLLGMGGGVYALEAAELRRDGEAAKDSGFASVERYRSARAVGYVTSEGYAEHQARQAEAAVLAADFNKVDRVEEFRQRANATGRAERERVSADATAERTREQEDAAECRNNPACFAAQNIELANSTCAPRVEMLSESYADWTNAKSEARFTRFKVKNLDAGIVTYMGDRIRFANERGGMVDQVYECDFDVTKNRVLAVRAVAGRLPRS